MITATFQTIDAEQLIRLLGRITEAECLGYAQLYKWEKRSDGTYFIKNHEATIKNRNVEERVKFGRKLSCFVEPYLNFFRVRRSSSSFCLSRHQYPTSLFQKTVIISLCCNKSVNACRYFVGLDASSALRSLPFSLLLCTW